MEQLYIDGKWVDPADGKCFATYDPATGAAITQVSAAGSGEVDQAVTAARRAFDEGPWGPNSSARDRAAVLFNAAAILRRRRDELAELEVRDNGKTLADAVYDVEEAAFMFEYYAGWATKVM